METADMTEVRAAERPAPDVSPRTPPSFVGGMDVAALGKCCNDELADTISQLHALEMAVRSTLLSVVSAYDQRKAWRDDGATSMAAWLAMRLDCGFATGSELARVSRAFSELPTLTEALGQGSLSWDKAASLARLATPESDARWAADAPGLSAAQLKLLASVHRPAAPDPTRRFLRLRTHGNGAWTRVSGELPGADGAVVTAALERLAEQVPPDPASHHREPLESRCADALVGLCSTALAADADADRACVVVHVDADVLAGESEDGARMANGPVIVAEAARRLACDARVEFLAHGAGDVVVGVSRTTRTVPAWLGRLLRHRDGGCRFPGCGRTRWTQSHHVIHWANGGPTDSSNLLTLCHFHHVLLHEGNWRLSGNPDHEVLFIRPDGRPLPNAPPKLRPDVARRLPPIRE